jgi:hypothetical protein
MNCVDFSGPCVASAQCCSPNTCDNGICGALKQCPGESIGLDLDASAPDAFQGTTNGVGQYYSYCGGTGKSSGPENIYSLKLAQGGTLSGQLKTPSFAGVVYVEKACGVVASTLACAVAVDGGAGFKIPVNAGDPLAVFVDGAHGSAGAYDLTLSLSKAKCGDGVVNTNNCAPCDGGGGCVPALGPGCEQCDYGAKQELGCDASSCGFEAPPDDPSYASNTCDGAQYTQIPGKMMVPLTKPFGMVATTVGYQDLNSATCGGPGGGPDRIYHVSNTIAGKLTLTATPLDFDLVLSVYATCVLSPLPAKVEGLIACSDQGGIGVAESVTFPVGPAVGDYFVVIGGANAKSYGEFNLTANLVP